MYTLITNIPLVRATGFVDEISKSQKEDSVTVFYKGSEIGYLTSDEIEMIPGTNPAKGLKKADIVGKFFVIQKFTGKDKNKYMVDLFPSIKKISLEKEKTKGEPVVFCMRSKPLLCEKSPELKQALVTSVDVPVWLIFGESESVDETSRIIYCVEKRFHEERPNPSDETLSKLSCGRFTVTDEMPTIPFELFLEHGMVLEGKARTPRNQWTNKTKRMNGDIFEVVSNPGTTEVTRDFSKIILRLNDECIDHPDSVQKKIQFMRNAKVSEDLIEAVLNSYICYHGAERLKIKHPVYPFQDSPDGYISRALTYFLTGANVRFVGDKGCGKNTLLDTLSWLMNQPLYKIGCSERTDEYTVFGSTQIKDGNTFHKLSPFATGLIKGGICVLDEANAASPELLIVINQLADKTREVDINNYGLLKLHERTRLCLTMNESYQGVAMMNEATVDRFQGIFMESGMNISQLFKFLVKDADDEYVEIAASIYKDIKEKVSSGALDPSCVTIRGYQDALMASKFIPIKTALIDSIAGRVQIEEDRQTIVSIINGKAVIRKKKPARKNP